MHKRVSLFLISFLSLFVLGMRGCAYEFVAGFIGDLTHMAYGNLFPGENSQALSRGLSDPIGIMVGDSGRIYTTRGRPPSPWVLRSSGTTQRLNFIAFYPFDTTQIFVAGNGGTILRSTNGGADWAQMTTGITRNLKAITVPSRTTAFAVGDSGLILWTTNSGTSWSPRTSGTTTNLRCVHAINDIFILAAGEGVIVGTSSGGGTWTTRFSDPTKTFNKFAFARPSVGLGVMWSVGNAGIVYRSTDLGSTWTPQTSSTTQNLNDVYFADAATGVVVGNGGTVRNTTDGGITWLTDSTLNSLTTENIRCIAPIYFSIPLRALIDSITVTGIAGNTVTTISTEPLTGVSEADVPFRHALDQNFPNPFNPTTRIRFRISDVGFVSLKVFDVAGREVASLVNEKLATGVHERSFDGAGLSSGIYFYQLTVGSRTEVKKLILLK